MMPACVLSDVIGDSLISHLDPEYLHIFNKRISKKEIERLGVDEENKPGICNIYMILCEKLISFHDDESQRNEPN